LFYWEKVEIAWYTPMSRSCGENVDGETDHEEELYGERSVNYPSFPQPEDCQAG